MSPPESNDNSTISGKGQMGLQMKQISCLLPIIRVESVATHLPLQPAEQPITSSPAHPTIAEPHISVGKWWPEWHWRPQTTWPSEHTDDEVVPLKNVIHFHRLKIFVKATQDYIALFIIIRKEGTTMTPLIHLVSFQMEVAWFHQYSRQPTTARCEAPMLVLVAKVDRRIASPCVFV